jgi:hypothetical protein
MELFSFFCKSTLIRSNLAKIACVVARLNQDARRIEYANHSVMRATEKLCRDDR